MFQAKQNSNATFTRSGLFIWSAAHEILLFGMRTFAVMSVFVIFVDNNLLCQRDLQSFYFSKLRTITENFLSCLQIIISSVKGTYLEFTGGQFSHMRKYIVWTLPNAKLWLCLAKHWSFFILALVGEKNWPNGLSHFFKVLTILY